MIKKKLTKNKTCKSCKGKFDQVRFGQVTCSIPCAISHGRKLEEKKKEAKAKAERKRIKEEKEKEKTLSQLKQDLQPIVNEIARLIDKGNQCISCGRIPKKENGGHYFATGGHDQLRFHLDNIHLQCEFCNNYKSGAPREFIENIGLMYGEQYKSHICHFLRPTFNDLRFDKEIIKEAIKVARKCRNKLKKLNQSYSPKMRIELRKDVNEQLNIYNKDTNKLL